MADLSMSERGIDKPGWLRRQMADLEREFHAWPERMKRAVREKAAEPPPTPVCDAAYEEHTFWPRRF